MLKRKRIPLYQVPPYIIIRLRYQLLPLIVLRLTLLINSQRKIHSGMLKRVNLFLLGAFHKLEAYHQVLLRMEIGELLWGRH